jgi:hypothetical protein
MLKNKDVLYYHKSKKLFTNTISIIHSKKTIFYHAILHNVQVPNSAIKQKYTIYQCKTETSTQNREKTSKFGKII